MTKAPMWTDDLDEQQLEPLTKAEFDSLRTGQRVRVVDPKGRVAQGTIENARGLGNGRSIHQIVLFGVTWDVNRVAIYRDSDGTRFKADINPDKVTLSEEGVRDIIVDLARVDELSYGDRALSVDLLSIVTKAVGFDPTIARSDTNFGGKSKDAWIREHFDLTGTRKHIDALVTSGFLRKVNDGSQLQASADNRFVNFQGRSKTGWVVTSAFERAEEAYASKQDDERLARLLATARSIVADRHDDEVQAELRRLLAE